MDLLSLCSSWNRAWSLTFSKPKLLLAFSFLALSGLISAFFWGLGWNQGAWIHQNLLFVSFFLVMAILLPLGILLIRLYYHEIKKNEVSLSQLLISSWDKLLHAAAIAFPFAAVQLGLSFLLGLFLLFQEMPLFGASIGILFGFIPLLLYLAMLALILVALLLLFVGSPLLALKEVSEKSLLQSALKCLIDHPLSNGLFFLLGLLPLMLSLLVLAPALYWTALIAPPSTTILRQMLSLFFLLLPSGALLTPSLIFFFHFAAESYSYFQKRHSFE